MKKKAILYTSNLEKLATLAEYLLHDGWEILSAGKTAQFLQSQNIPCTVSPILEQNANSDDSFLQLLHMILSSGRNLFSSKIYSESSIQLVCMDLNPIFRGISDYQEIDKSDNFMDLQHVTLIHAAAKNYMNVILLTDPADYEEAIIQMKTESLSDDFKLYLAGKALNLISAFEASESISIFMRNTHNGFPNFYAVPYQKYAKIKYGANERQNCMLYSVNNQTGAFNGIRKLQGRDFNLLILKDCSTAWKCISLFMKTIKKTLVVETTDCNNYSYASKITPSSGGVLAVVIKHKNPVGAAIRGTLLEAFRSACASDYESVAGSVFSCSCVVDESAAHEIANAGFECVVAPDFTKEAREILKTNENLRLIIASKLTSDFDECFSIDGALMVQNPDSLLFDKLSVVTQNRPTQNQLDSMAFGMIIAMISTSASAVVVNDFYTVGISSGNVSSKKAVHFALQEASSYFANNNLSSEQRTAEILVSDSKIEFNESVKQIVDVGIKAVIQTGGTEKDEEFIQFCNENGIVMVFTGIQHQSI